jgi:calcineurin-like phosphoesterase family protein
MTERIWFSSDNHYFHKNILKFCPTTRRGNSIEEMNELMIEAHNAKVQQHDRVYFLGDFCFGNAQDAEGVIKRLGGRKHLIYGNHDKVLKSNVHLQKYFESVQDYKEITIEGQKVVMFHFPMREWNSMHHGSYHLFGHVHGNLENEIVGRSMDVGVDTRPNADMAPWSWEEVHAILQTREVRTHHGKVSM